MNKNKIKVEVELVFLVILLIAGGYFLVFHHGITGALTGLSEAPVDSEILQQLETEGEVSVVVILRGQPEIDESLESKKEKISNNQQKVLNDLDLEDSKILGIKQEQEFDLDHKYETVNAFSGKITKDGLKKLQKDYNVAEIKFDSAIYLLLSESGPLIKSNLTNSLGFTGKGETVCVVDTGVDYTHHALGNCSSSDFIDGSCSKVIAGADIADNDNDPRDLNGHGSHVAGIVASSDETYKGIAPDSKIAAVKVFPGSSGGTNLSNVIGGLDWCINNSVKYNISIITLSLGDGAKYKEPCDTHPLSLVVNNAVSSGIFVDVASGNNGFTNGINAPACASKVAAVGATDKQGNLASYSNFADMLKLLTPGSSITSTVLNPSFGTKSGTSMAAPHVAGAAAVLRQYWKEANNESLTPAQIISRLVDTGKVVKKGNDNYYLVDLHSAILPKIIVSSPVNGSILNQSFILLEMNSDSQLYNAWVEIIGDNTTYEMVKLNKTYFTFNLTNVTESLSYKIYGNNSVGLIVSSKLQSLIIETIPPEVVFTFNKTFANTGIINLDVSVIDRHSLVDSVKFNLSKGNFSSIYNATKTNSSWILEINVSSLSEGDWLINLLATDSRGNLNDTESVLLIVDKTIPLLSTFSVNNQTFYKNSSIEFKVNASDSNLNLVLVETNLLGNLQNYTLLIDNSSNNNNNNNNNSGNNSNVSNIGNIGNIDNIDNIGISSNNNYVLSFTGNLNRGNISFVFHVTDFAGNIVSSGTNYINVQNNIPTGLTITSPNDGDTYDQNVSITFSANANDLDGDVLTYDWSYGDGVTDSGSSLQHSFSSSGTYPVTVTVSDSLSTVSNSINIEINAPVTNPTPDNSNDDTSTDTPSSESSGGSGSGGGSGGGSGSSGTSQPTSIPSNDDFEFPEIEGVVFEETSNNLVKELQVEELTEDVFVEPSQDEVKKSNRLISGFALVGGTVTDIIGNHKGIGYGMIIGVSLLVTILIVYIVLKKRHELEIYGVEAVKMFRNDDKDAKKEARKKINFFKYLPKNWLK